jgi:hypothetical protein
MTKDDSLFKFPTFFVIALLNCKQIIFFWQLIGVCIWPMKTLNIKIWIPNINVKETQMGNQKNNPETTLGTQNRTNTNKTKTK